MFSGPNTPPIRLNLQFGAVVISAALYIERKYRATGPPPYDCTLNRIPSEKEDVSFLSNNNMEDVMDTRFSCRMSLAGFRPFFTSVAMGSFSLINSTTLESVMLTFSIISLVLLRVKGYDGKKIVMSSTVNQVNDMDFQFVHSPLKLLLLAFKVFPNKSDFS